MSPNQTPKKSATKSHSSARVSHICSEGSNSSKFSKPFPFGNMNHPESLAASPPVSQAVGSNILDKGHAMNEEPVPNEIQPNAPLMPAVNNPSRQSMDAVSPMTASIVQEPPAPFSPMPSGSPPKDSILLVLKPNYIHTTFSYRILHTHYYPNTS